MPPKRSNLSRSSSASRKKREKIAKLRELLWQSSLTPEEKRQRSEMDQNIYHAGQREQRREQNREHKARESLYGEPVEERKRVLRKRRPLSLKEESSDSDADLMPSGSAKMINNMTNQIDGKVVRKVVNTSYLRKRVQSSSSESCQTAGIKVEALPALQKPDLPTTGPKTKTPLYMKQAPTNQQPNKTVSVYSSQNLYNSGDKVQEKSMINKVQCNLCPRTFYLASSLSQHYYRNHCVTCHICTVCNKQGFASAADLADHMTTHTVQNSYLCDQCPETFSDLEHKIAHLQTVHGINEKAMFKCNTCGNYYDSALYVKFIHRCRNKTALKEAALAKSNGMSIATVIANGNVRYHRSPTNNSHAVAGASSKSGTAFECHVCGKAFSQSIHLRIHLKEHKNIEVSHRCELCDQSFSSFSELTDHLRNHLRMPVTFSCSDCSLNFPSQSELDEHLMKHTEKFTVVSKKAVIMEDGQMFIQSVDSAEQEWQPQAEASSTKEQVPSQNVVVTGPEELPHQIKVEPGWQEYTS